MSVLNYTELATTERRYFMPLLSVRLRGPEGLLPLRLLVDSGAAESIVPEALLRQIGVEISDEKVRLEAASGSQMVGRVAHVQIEVPACGNHYVSRVLAVTDGIAPLLGHHDLFLNYWIGFNSSTRQFYVSPSRTRR